MVWDDEDAEFERYALAHRRLYRWVAVAVLIAFVLGFVVFMSVAPQHW